ncbi:MAG: TlpA family protein disulfide reductase, partial [Lachnospiraceae bacterium]|nr:TlpA family protein disulfide reductase [Lachnospiraceae bacterium]
MLVSNVTTESADKQEAATTVEEETTEPEKVPAPDFTVIDAEGNEVKLSDMRGKPVVVNFWASWCGPCKMEMPEFEEVYKELGDEVHFMMVNLTDGWQETQ